MNILVLVKAVPLVGEERFSDGPRTLRSDLEANGADEYCLERALQLTEAHGGEVSLLTMGPDGAAEALRKGLAMGAARAYHVDDPALAGSDILATLRVLEAALRHIDVDLLFSGADSSDGDGGVMGAALATRLGWPYLGNAAEVSLSERQVRVERLGTAGREVLEASLPAVVMGMQLLGEPRYPSLRGVMGARKKPTTTWTLADLGIDTTAVGAAASEVIVDPPEYPEPRQRARLIDAPADEAARLVADELAARGLL